MSILRKFTHVASVNCLRGAGGFGSSVQSNIMSHVRHSSYRVRCAEGTMPRCSEENLKKLCAIQAKRPKKELDLVKMKEECCDNPCPDAFPRFDDLYYKPSDKAKRKYMITWVECPELRLVPKQLCCYELGGVPPMKRRSTRGCKPQTACVVTDSCVKGALTRGKCRKIVWPGCRGARDPPKCKRERAPSGCQKVCAPYPSYSECDHPPPNKPRPMECHCLDIPNTCDVYAAWRAIQKAKEEGSSP